MSNAVLLAWMHRGMSMRGVLVLALRVFDRFVAGVGHASAHLAAPSLRILAFFELHLHLRAAPHEILGFDLDHPVRRHTEPLEHMAHAPHATIAPRQGVPSRRASVVHAADHLESIGPACAAIARHAGTHLGHPAHMRSGRNADIGLDIIHVAEIELHGLVPCLVGMAGGGLSSRPVRSKARNGRPVPGGGRRAARRNARREQSSSRRAATGLAPHPPAST